MFMPANTLYPARIIALLALIADTPAALAQSGQICGMGATS